MSSPVILINTEYILTGAEKITMPDELDPITARLVSELSAKILPVLSKSLSEALPAADFSVSVERVNRTAQEIKTSVERALRANVDDSRAGRSMIIQSIENLIGEISTLSKKIETFPNLLEAGLKNINFPVPEVKNNEVPEELLKEIDVISDRVGALTEGIKVFCETYAERRETVQPTFDPEILSGLEGLVRAEGKSHSRELEEFSREISTMTEESNTALLHEVRDIVSDISVVDVSGHSGNDDGVNVKKFLRLAVILSGAGVALTVLNLILLMVK